MGVGHGAGQGADHGASHGAGHGVGHGAGHGAGNGAGAAWRRPWGRPMGRTRRWFGHVEIMPERMDKGSRVKKCREIVVKGHRGRGVSRKTLDEVVRGDLRVLNIQRDVAQDRVKWKCYQVNPSNP